MSKVWYPIINYERCKGCFSCYNKCKNGVYTLTDNKKSPLVIFPDGCVTGCTGCAKLCPEQAISYFGDAEEVNCCN